MRYPTYSPRFVKSLITTLLVVIVVGFGGRYAAGQSGSGTVAEHVAAAKAAGGQVWPGLVSNLCDPATASEAPAAAAPAARGAPPPGPPPRNTWYRGDPTKVFDNLYVFSTKGGRWGGVTVWAIKTSAGLIVIDSLYDYAIKDEMAAGMRKVGLDPSQIKAAFITHGHGDHFGGAKSLQELYSTKVYMSAADWDYMVKQAQAGTGQAQPLPKKDMVATDGQKFTLGDTTITVYMTPGHTPGTISFLIPVKINGIPHMAAFWGGTAISPNTGPDNLKQYSASVKRFETLVKEEKVDIMLSNHEAFGQYVGKIAAMRANPAGPNPFVVGTDGVLRFLEVLDQCSQANFAAAASARRTPASR